MALYSIVGNVHMDPIRKCRKRKYSYEWTLMFGNMRWETVSAPNTESTALNKICTQMQKMEAGG